jgi:nicotinamidase-related amidase
VFRGKWSPEYLNHNLTWTDQNGLNSLQIVSWLLSAYRLTGDPKFQHEINKLVEKHQYGINIINTKDVHPGDDNYSDDVRCNLFPFHIIS